MHSSIGIRHPTKHHYRHQMIHPFRQVIEFPINAARSLQLRAKDQITSHLLWVPANLPHVHHCLSPRTGPLFGDVDEPSFPIMGCGTKGGTFRIEHFA